MNTKQQRKLLTFYIEILRSCITLLCCYFSLNNRILTILYTAASASIAKVPLATLFCGTMEIITKAGRPRGRIIYRNPAKYWHWWRVFWRAYFSLLPLNASRQALLRYGHGQTEWWVDGHLEKMARQQGTAKLHKKRAKSEHDDNCPPTNPSS